jgi:hypothetical protein
MWITDVDLLLGLHSRAPEEKEARADAVVAAV